MANENERLKILDMIDKGQISAQDGIRLLAALGEGMDAEEEPAPEALPEATTETASSPSATAESQDSPSASTPQDNQEAGAPPPRFEGQPEVISPRPSLNPEMSKWRGFWWIPLWVGVGVTLIGALLMYLAYNNSGFGFWFACTWFPFSLGVLIMALAWASRSARWLHLRVHQKEGERPQRIAISLPLPLRLTAWLLRTFGKNIPNLGNTGLDELIMALDSTSPDAPFYVEVNEGSDGERVEVYIG